MPFAAYSGDAIEWVDGAILTDGSAGEALRNDFADSVNAEMERVLSKPVGVDVDVWK